MFVRLFVRLLVCEAVCGGVRRAGVDPVEAGRCLRSVRVHAASESTCAATVVKSAKQALRAAAPPVPGTAGRGRHPAEAERGPGAGRPMVGSGKCRCVPRLAGYSN